MPAWAHPRADGATPLMRCDGASRTANCNPVIADALRSFGPCGPVVILVHRLSLNKTLVAMAYHYNPSLPHADPRVADNRRGLAPRSLFASSPPAHGEATGIILGGAPPPKMPVPVRGGLGGGSDPCLPHPGPGPATLPSAVLSPPPTYTLKIQCCL